MLNLIPAARQAAVLTALQTTFNTTHLNAINSLHGGGSSSFTLKIIIKQQAYVLRVMGLDQPLGDRSTQVDSLTKAAALTIAPRCYYANAEVGIIIMAYIPSQPIIEREHFLIDLAHIVKHLHQTIDLLPVFITTFDYLNGLT
jgi:5-methylthioribose kinase